MVGAVEVDAVVALVVARLLAGLDPAVDRIRKHDHQQRRLVPHDGFQFTHREAEAAVAHHRHALRLRAADPRAERRRHRKAQCA
ncbi:hypothetical protein G6F57_022117 [Rhizopus arrhizus]|nr:hypothetical protein G6F57_022117 [Rhizopus arrhizus]